MKRTMLIRGLVAIGLLTLAGVALGEAFLLHRMDRRLDNLEARPVLVHPGFDRDGFPAPLAMNGFHPIFDTLDRDFAALDGFWMPVPQVPGMQPTTRIDRTDKGYRVEVALPGMKPQDVKVSVDGQLLSIDAQAQGNSRTQAGREQEDTHYSSRFSESFTLPGPVNAQGMRETFQDGKLTVTLPRASV